MINKGGQNDRMWMLHRRWTMLFHCSHFSTYNNIYIYIYTWNWKLENLELIKYVFLSSAWLTWGFCCTIQMWCHLLIRTQKACGILLALMYIFYFITFHINRTQTFCLFYFFSCQRYEWSWIVASALYTHRMQEKLLIIHLVWTKIWARYLNR